LGPIRACCTVDQIHIKNKVLYALQGLDTKEAQANEVRVGGDLILKKGVHLSATVKISIQDGKLFLVCVED
jgi:hypothetical protein